MIRKLRENEQCKLIIYSMYHVTSKVKKEKEKEIIDTRDKEEELNGKTNKILSCIVD